MNTSEYEIELSWDLEGFWNIAFTTTSLFLCGWLVYYVFYTPFPRARYATLHLGGMSALLSLLFLHEVYNNEKRRPRDWANVFVLVVYIIGAILASLYIYFEFEALQTVRLVNYNMFDLIAGTFLILIVIDLTLRKYGKIIGGLSIFAILYSLYGIYFPGLLGHAGLDLTRTISTLSIEFNGVLGSIFQVVALWVYVFMLYAGILKAFGALEFFIDIGTLIGSRLEKGLPQIAIISSMIMGSLMGSALANTAITGNITIPMMTNQGLRRRTAAAVEAVASSGGQILPPIMGVVAFIMAQRLGLPYADIVIAGTLPALLFFIPVAFSVFIFSHREEVSRVSHEWNTDPIKIGTPVMISFITLAYTLIILRMSPDRSGIYTIISFIVPAIIINVYYTSTIDEVLNSIKRTAEGIVQGTIDMAPLAVLVAGLDVVIQIFGVTGLATKIAVRMTALTAGELLLAAMLVMIMAILFGFGLPTVPAYLFTATLGAPVLIEFGIEPLTAHFFVFYFAVLSAITPPVAITVAVGSQIAKSNFVLTALRAMLLGAPAFVLPYIFLYRQELLFIRFPGSFITFGFAAIGLCIFVVILHLLSIYTSRTISRIRTAYMRDTQ